AGGSRGRPPATRPPNCGASRRNTGRGVVVSPTRAREGLGGGPGPLLRAQGAVSEPVARAMAEGVCRISGSPCGLAVTGIAGPDGGSAEKPVGTVYIGCATPEGIEVRRCRFDGDRVAIKWQSSQTAPDMLRRRLGR